MTDVSIVTPLVKKILQTMKLEERVSLRVRPECYVSYDQAIISKFNVDTKRDLYLDIEMKSLVRVEDVYKDGTTLTKTLKKGQGTASPYSDF
jgi:hypoxanthine-guanine phosphoribosyltransferase